MYKIITGIIILILFSMGMNIFILGELDKLKTKDIMLKKRIDWCDDMRFNLGEDMMENTRQIEQLKYDCKND